jgi:hypothetical protein
VTLSQFKTTQELQIAKSLAYSDVEIRKKVNTSVKFGLKCISTSLLAIVTSSLCSCGKTSNDSPEPKADQLHLVTLNPDEYHQEITDIDRAVFAADPFDDARHELLTANLEKLAQQVKSAGDSRFLKMEADEIMTLARMSRKMREEGLRTQLPNQWMRIRNNLFEDRYWFAHSAADLEQPSKTAP